MEIKINMTCKILAQVFIIFLPIVISIGQIKINQLEGGNAFVVFDPYLSALDTHNRNRYDEKDLITLVSKVASKFRRFYIPLSHEDIYSDTSISRSPFAVAEYNKLSSTSQPQEVWLAYDTSSGHDSRTEKNITDLTYVVNRMLDIALKTNLIHNGTLTAVIFPYQLFLKMRESFVTEINDGLQLGILMPPEYIKFIYHPDLWDIFGPRLDVIVIGYEPFDNENTIIPRLQNTMGKLRKFFAQERHVKFFCYRITIADTNKHGKVNMRNVVSAWKASTKFGLEKNITIIFNKAFDTPYSDSIEQKTCGLWRLVENMTYTSTDQFVFEDKIQLMGTNNKIDADEDLKLKALWNQIRFSKTYIGTVFSLRDIQGSTNQIRLPGNAIDLLLQNVAEQIQTVVVLYPLSANEHSDSFYFVYELLKIYNLPDKCDVWVIVPIQQLPKSMNDTIYGLGGVIDLLPNLHGNYEELTQFVEALDPSDFQEDNTETMKSKIIKVFMRTKGIKPSFDISTCQYFSLMDAQEKQLADKMFKGVYDIVFHITELEGNVRLGAKRMFSQRVVQMEQCRQFIYERRNFKYAHMSFLIFHYEVDEKFYQSKWEMLNFIEYWRLLNDWANKTKTTIIFNNAADMYRYIENSKEIKLELGWWRYQDPLSTGVSGVSHNNEIWVNKIDDTIARFTDTQNRSSRSSNLTQTKLQTINLILLVVIPVILVCIVVIIVAIYFTRRFFRETNLTKLEIKEFHEGHQNETLSEEGMTKEADKIPYDKARYEIASKAFRIGDELGSGEFGKVCTGTILTDEIGLRKVAIKMINPLNINATSLHGLLSEIKILSYIGKHENITQLIGANTEKLTSGKVYVFLELCELGSLLSYLHKMRPTMVDESTKQEALKRSTLDARVDKYLEMVAMTKISLGPSLSQDLYRWSHEICNGMAYIAKKHVVHADLATRNVLLTSDKVAKICDFGLSTRMDNYKNYVKKQQELVPWRWMPPETLRMLKFNEKSDVWAYGVTLWEIYTLGDTPYVGLPYDFQFAGKLERGLRLDEPKYIDRNMYDIMRDCWQTNPQSRPTFEDLLGTFN